MGVGLLVIDGDRFGVFVGVDEGVVVGDLVGVGVRDVAVGVRPGQTVSVGVFDGVLVGVKLIVGVILGVGVGVYLNAIFLNILRSTRTTCIHNSKYREISVWETW